MPGRFFTCPAVPIRRYTCPGTSRRRCGIPFSDHRSRETTLHLFSIAVDVIDSSLDCCLAAEPSLERFDFAKASDATASARYMALLT